MTQLKPDERTIPEPMIEALWELWAKMGRQPRMRMITGSMQPLIKEGDELHIELQPKVIHLGEVLIYRHRGQFIAHRLVDIRQSGEKERFILKGDAILNLDPPLPRERIIGRVICVEGASGCADYNSMRWRIFNLLIALFSKSDKLYRIVKRYARRVIKRI
jgi:signal peptidase I